MTPGGRVPSGVVLAATIRKDVGLLLADRGALTSLFLLPIVFITVFGSMFGGGGGGDGAPPRIPVAHADENTRAAAVVRVIDGSGLFITERASAAEVRRRVVEEEARAGLVFADDFDPLLGRPAELVIDRAAPIQVRAPLEGALTGLIGRALLGGHDLRLAVATSPPGARAPLDQVSGFQVAVPGNAVLFGFFLALSVGLSYVGERRSGTLRRLLAAPVRRPLLLVAKLVPFFLVGLVQMAVLFGVGAFVFGMRVAGSVPGLCVLTVSVVLAATCLGLLIASFAGTERQVGGVGSICLLVMGLLGGGMVPRLSMSSTMQAIGLATPHGWALDGYYDLLIREGTTLADVLPQVGAVLAFAAAFAAIGAWRFDLEG